MSTSIQPMPPRWPQKALRMMVRADFLEEIEGDMEERYLDNLEFFSPSKSRRLYIWDTLKIILRPQLLKRLGGDHRLNTYGMFENYFKVTIRNLKKRKVYSAIKIGGFALGIALSILISLFVLDEFRIDQHLVDKPVYRILHEGVYEGEYYQSTSVPPILAPSLEEDYPEVVKAGRTLTFDGFGDAGGNLVRFEGKEKSIFEERFGYLDAVMPGMLDFKFVYGDRETALSEPFSLIMSRDKAEKYFPGEDPVGKLMYLNENEKFPYQVQGVFESLEDTHLNQLDFFFTLSGKEFWDGEQTSWCCYNYTTYLELAKGGEASFRSKLKSAHDQYFVSYAEQTGNASVEDIRANNTLGLQKVSEIYLNSAGIYDFLTVSDIRNVWAFAAIAIFILLLACINFINLSTANSGSRAKEIGLRKAVGSHRKDIIYQFLIEAMVLTAIAVFLGTILAWASMPLFNSITDKTIIFPFAEPLFYVLLAGLTFFIGLLSGLYPSLYLSSFQPIAALSDGLTGRGKKANVWLRNILVLIQLTISSILIVGAISVYHQMDFILTKDVGFEKDQVVMIQGFNSLREQMETFKNEVLAMPEVQNATISSSLPVSGTHRNGNAFYLPGRRGIDKSVGGQFWRADDDYFETLGIEFVKGRSFDLDRASDSTSAVINEAMAREFNLGNPLESEIENFLPWKIVGVVKDFHFDHLKDEVRPVLIAPGTFGDMLTVKLQTEDMKGTMGKLENIWEAFKPNQLFRYEFLDQRFRVMYEALERTKTLLLIFATFSVIVACLGLFGLSVFTVAQRNKEMTIRKVLGASVNRIMGLLTVDYLKLVILALILGFPISWFVIDEWLAGFEYRIPDLWGIMILAGILTVITCLGVVSMQSFRAAVANPADGLRDE